MLPSTLGRILTLALAVSVSACLDFDQYGEGGGAGGESAGGAPEGGGPEGGGGSAPTCPSDNVVPAAVCITGSVYDFENKLLADWSRTELGSVSNLCGGSCAAITLGENRLDLRTLDIGVVDECFASIDLLPGGDAQRTFLELVPDGAASTGDIPEPDRINNVEVAVAGNTVRFEVGTAMIPALVLDASVTVDQLRIQVRAGTVVLEAFAAGQQVACSEQPRPAALSEPVRAGFGVQGSPPQQASFDNYGALAD